MASAEFVRPRGVDPVPLSFAARRHARETHLYRVLERLADGAAHSREALTGLAGVEPIGAVLGELRRRYGLVIAGVRRPEGVIYRLLSPAPAVLAALVALEPTEAA